MLAALVALLAELLAASVGAFAGALAAGLAGALAAAFVGALVAGSALYWPADEVCSQTLGRLRLGDLCLRYTSCHIASICFVQNSPRSCLVR
jgi:hypothetical protein